MASVAEVRETHTLHLDYVDVELRLDSNGSATIRFQVMNNSGEPVILDSEDWADVTAFWNEVTHADE